MTRFHGYDSEGALRRASDGSIPYVERRYHDEPVVAERRRAKGLGDGPQVPGSHDWVANSFAGALTPYGEGLDAYIGDLQAQIKRQREVIRKLLGVIDDLTA